ncbi:transglycosylase domain-containing protein [Nesterenkonia haasae]|uniref:transglycosylase domain-containing protein n=1 Tax=Nesterenkonia haasae TaxID=2587813 RepID=UPI001390DC88|nr:transglycosylase domain-containing protein [Nesterenkonia haasae]
MGKIPVFLAISAFCGALAALMVFPIAASTGALARMGEEVLDEHPAELREAPESLPSVFYAADGTEIARFYAENREPVSIDDISTEMIDAIVSIEDERFYEHGGTDLRAIARAAVNNLATDTRQGGSTISIQYASLLVLNADSLEGRERLVMGGTTTMADRLYEARLAVSLEEHMTKEEILEGYLNIVLFGQQNYGVEAAAQYYWGVSAAELNTQQAALLAGMVQSPNYFDPVTNPEAATSRRNVVLGTMLRNGYISEPEYQEAAAADLDLVDEPQAPGSGCIAADLAPYFCDYVYTLLEQDPALGEDVQERRELIARGGLHVHTTLDAEMQRAAEEEVLATMPVGEPEGVIAAINTLDPRNGDILAMAQSTTYSPEDDGNGATSVNFNVGGVNNGGIGFPGGSTLKPFVAAAWIEEGGSMDDVVDASQTEYEYGEEWEASCRPGGSITLLPDGAGDTRDAWPVGNVAENMEIDMTVDFGLFHSLNTATLATAYEMDLCAITDVTDRLGLVNPDVTIDRGFQVNLNEGIPLDTPSFVLGSQVMHPLTMGSAYIPFARDDGQRCEPRAVESVTDRLGNELVVPEVDCQDALDPEVAAQVNDTLINIAEQQNSVGAGGPPFPMAGKTGTSHTASATWFMGFTEGLVTTSYVGRYQGIEQLYERTIDGVYYEEIYGSTLAAPMWYAYMTRDEVGHAYPHGDFPEASNSPFDDRRTPRYTTAQATGPTLPGDG